jgi:hypothetical protein
MLSYYLKRDSPVARRGILRIPVVTMPRYILAMVMDIFFVSHVVLSVRKAGGQDFLFIGHVALVGR